MRASQIALIAAILTIPSFAYAQADGPVGGKVGADLGTSSTVKPGTSPNTRPYGGASDPGPRAGASGSVMSGQVVPQDVQVTPRAGGQGTAIINGHRVLVDPNSNRVLHVFN
jgi:hypothetical protein